MICHFMIPTVCLYLFFGVPSQCAEATGSPASPAAPKSTSSTTRKRKSFIGENITLRGGVLLQTTPNMIAYNAGQNKYTGFQAELLDHIQAFAREDGYNLKFELSPLSQQYNDALNLVANDCNTTANPLPLEECRRFDMIVGDYFRTYERWLRVDFSPTWVHTEISSVKKIEDTAEGQSSVQTLTNLQVEGGAACVIKNSYIPDAVLEYFPEIDLKECSSMDECISWLKGGVCSLYTHDELVLQYHVMIDSELEMSGEKFRTTYIVWPIRRALDPETSSLLSKWIHATMSRKILNGLHDKYLSVRLCPLGLAGENCTKSCDRNHGLSDRHGTCVCQSPKWTGDDCSIQVKENLNLFPSWEIALCYMFFGINALACILCAAWMHMKRSNQLVKVSQPFFLSLVLLGCAISSSSIIPLVQQSEGDGPVAACAVFPWLFCVGFSVTFGTLFAKIRRTYKLFKASARAVRIKVKKRETMMVVGIITSVDVLICIIWTAVDPLKWNRVVTSQDQFGEPLESIGCCTSTHWSAFISAIAAWHVLLLIGGSFICYQTRNISDRFVESRSLILVMVSNLQIYLISIPVMLLIRTNSSASLFIRSAVIWLNNFVVISIIFGGLMRAVYKDQGEGIDFNATIVAFANESRIRGHPGQNGMQQGSHIGGSHIGGSHIGDTLAQIRRRASLSATASTLASQTKCAERKHKESGENTGAGPAFPPCANDDMKTIFVPNQDERIITAIRKALDSAGFADFSIRSDCKGA